MKDYEAANKWLREAARKCCLTIVRSLAPSDDDPSVSWAAVQLDGIFWRDKEEFFGGAFIVTEEMWTWMSLEELMAERWSSMVNYMWAKACNSDPDYDTSNPDDWEEMLGGPQSTGAM